jgi:hypothetical protein
MNHDGTYCRYCNRHFKFKDLCDQHTISCEFLYRSKTQRDRDTDLLESLPTPQEQFKLIQHLMCKVASMEKEILKLKGVSVTRKRKVILEWLNSPSGPKPAMLFNVWGKDTEVSFEHLQSVFEPGNDITDGMKSCLRDYCVKNTPIPICSFTQKSNTLYIWTSDGDNPQWRTLDATAYTKWIDRIAHRFLESFLKWQFANAHTIRATEEAKDQNISNMRKINGCGHAHEERRRNELRKWIFSHIAQDFIHNVEYECV